MGFDATSESSDNGSFGNAVKIGLTLGLFPGVILGIAYMFTPSITNRVDLVGTAALLILVSSLFGAIVGSLIYLVTRSLLLAWWILNILAGSFLSVCILLESSVIAPISVLFIPIFLLFYKFLSENLPKWIKEAIDRVMVEVLVGCVFAGLILLLDPLTGNLFSESVKPNLNIFAEQILMIFRNWLHR
jgi:hypothetical protein